MKKSNKIDWEKDWLEEQDILEENLTGGGDYGEEEYNAGDGDYTEEEYYAEDGDYAEEEYYAEDGDYAEEEYYAEDDTYTEEEYYADDEYSDAEDVYEEEYYIDENGVEWGGVIQEPIHRHSPKGNRKPHKKVGFIAWIGNMTAGLTALDKIAAAVGVIILAVSIVAVSIWSNTRGINAQLQEVGNVGQNLAGIDVIGESGLLAVTNAYIAGLTASLETEEEGPVAQTTEVTVSFTSIQQDLKIKFLDASTGNLVTGILFEVELVDSKGKSTVLKDDDLDGIIYATDLTAGDYQVTIKSAGGIQFPATAQTVKVKDKIEYKKVDVANEIKTEKQVNAAAEDTGKVDEIEQQTLVNTVEWVASTATPIGDGSGFEKVDKSTIPDPRTVALAIGSYVLLESRISISPTTLSLKVDGESKISASLPGASGNVSYSCKWSSSDEGIVYVSAAGGDVRAVGVGTATIRCDLLEVTQDGEEVSERLLTDEYATCTVTVTQPVTVTSVTMSPTTLNLVIAGTSQLTATAKMSDNSTATSGMTWTSSNTAIAAVDANGNVTAVAIGTATITATKDDKSAACSVTVGPALAVTLSKTSETLKAKGLPLQLTATVTGDTNADLNKKDKVSWTSSNTSVATVDETGKVTPLAAGTADIVATSKSNTAVSAKCTVTVTAGVDVTFTPSPVQVKQGAKVTITAALTNAPAKYKLTWTSADTKIATVAAVNGTPAKADVTGVAVGKVNMVLTVTEQDANGKDLGIVATAKCEVTVGNDAENDTVTKLKNKSGDIIYVKGTDGKFKEAVYADYFKYTEFYKKLESAYTYTGWQTIDNKTYFFDKKGKAVTGDQVIQGVKYHFASDGVLSMGSGTLGIDVSKWNGTINWTAVKNSGVSYVIIRCGYRGSSTGALIEDPMFKANIKGAQAAGLKIGVYFFTQAVNEVEAVQEASMVLSLIKGYSISYPVFIDTESSGGRGDNIDKATRTAVMNAFCKTIQNGGYTAGIYASKSWFETKLDMSSLNGYKIWLAQYASAVTYKGRYDMWQYTSKGYIGGINGYVDLNNSYLGY